jgi:hypothetical protein
MLVQEECHQSVRSAMLHVGQGACPEEGMTMH